MEVHWPYYFVWSLSFRAQSYPAHFTIDKTLRAEGATRYFNQPDKWLCNMNKTIFSNKQKNVLSEVIFMTYVSIKNPLCANTAQKQLLWSLKLTVQLRKFNWFFTGKATTGRGSNEWLQFLRLWYSNKLHPPPWT